MTRLVGAYLRQTELEKAHHLSGVARPDDDMTLPERYRCEVERPYDAYRDAVVYVAELGGSPVGIAVAQEMAGALEIKRVWVDPEARGHRVGSALMDAVLGEQHRSVRLTVWDWRIDAIRLYQNHGFVAVPSWEERRRLLCMERSARAGPSPNQPATRAACC